MRTLFHNFGVIGIILRFFFGTSFCGRGGQSISANKLVGLFVLIYGTIQHDVVLVGLAIGQFCGKAAIDMVEHKGKNYEKP